MTKCRKALSLLLTILMVFSLFPMMVSAEGTTDPPTQPTWPAEGSIHLDKEAKAVYGQSNVWEITLGIQGKNYKTTSDVVLVIDCSGSMESTKLTNTRTAAKAFGEKLLKESSSTRIAIVTYIDEATAYNNGHFYGAGELTAFQTAVDAATYANGGTNQQAGLHKAQELLASTASTGKLKNIVILSDGEATFSYKITGTATWTGCTSNSLFEHSWNDGLFGKGKVESNSVVVTSCDYNKRTGSGSDFNSATARLTVKCKHNKTQTVDYTINNGVATIWEANQAKTAGTTIFSVALQAGTNGENTLRACATDATTGYYTIGKDDNVEQTLTSAFQAIAGSIAIAASNGVVNDPMGEDVKLSFSGAEPVITTDEAAYKARQADVYISQGTATYDAATSTIKWEVGDVRESVTNYPIMKYRITLKNPGNNPATGTIYDANGPTTFNYINYQDQPVEADFPIPTVTVGGGNIRVHYYLVNSEGKPINENGVVVTEPKFAKEVKPAAYFEDENGSTGLKYKTTYTVPAATIENYTYSGYILNNDPLTAGDSAEVTLTAANSNQNVWFAYKQGFQVVHVKDGTAGTPIPYSIGDTVEDIYKDGLFNLTAAVTTGYLYGGTFEGGESSTYTTVHHEFTGENAKNPTSFHPTAGATYYIWEVHNEYLRPKSLSVWLHRDANNVDVIAFFLVAPIDRAYYNKVGFTVNNTDIDATKITTDYYAGYESDGSVIVQDIGPVVYETIKLRYKNGYGEYQLKDFMSQKYIDKVNQSPTGYLGCVSVDKDTYWSKAGNEFTAIPYWVTLDGVKVTGVASRTCTYNGQGPDNAPNNNHKMIVMSRDNLVTGGAQMEYAAASGEDTTRAMMVRSTYLAAPIAEPETPPTEPETPPVEPENPPVEPENPPVEPETPPTEPETPPTEPETPPTEPETPPTEPETPPTEPENPPVEPENPPVEPENPPVEPATVTVTVHDGNDVYTLAVMPDGDLTGTLAYRGRAGALFAGWYTDESYGTPAELTHVTADLHIYAKYVSDSYLRVRTQWNPRSFWDPTASTTLISTVDSEMYRETGMIIGGEPIPLRPIMGSAYAYGDMFRVYGTGELQLRYDLDMSAYRRGDKVEVTPYWITLDGTTVYGTSRTLTATIFGFRD